MAAQDDLPKVKETDTPDNVQELLAVEQAIKTRIVQAENLKEELSKQKEMLKSMLENNPEYLEKEKDAKEATREKTAAKLKVLNTPEGKLLNQKIKDLAENSRELQDGLSYYLREYSRMTGATQFEGEDGEIREIVYIAKLVRKTSLNQ